MSLKTWSQDVPLEEKRDLLWDGGGGSQYGELCAKGVQPD